MKPSLVKNRYPVAIQSVAFEINFYVLVQIVMVLLDEDVPLTRETVIEELKGRLHKEGYGCYTEPQELTKDHDQLYGQSINAVTSLFPEFLQQKGDAA